MLHTCIYLGNLYFITGGSGAFRHFVIMSSADGGSVSGPAMAGPRPILRYSSSDERQLEKYFFESILHGSGPPSPNELKEFCIKHRLPYHPDLLKKLRHRFKFTSQFASFKNPPAYISASFLSYGCIMIDLAYFKSNLKIYNEGCECKFTCVYTIVVLCSSHCIH